MLRVRSRLMYAVVGGAFLASITWTAFLIYEAGRLLFLTFH
jgi:hypothetical protein